MHWWVRQGTLFACVCGRVLEMRWGMFATADIARLEDACRNVFIALLRREFPDQPAKPAPQPLPQPAPQRFDPSPIAPELRCKKVTKTWGVRCGNAKFGESEFCRIHGAPPAARRPDPPGEKWIGRYSYPRQEWPAELHDTSDPLPFEAPPTPDNDFDDSWWEAMAEDARALRVNCRRFGIPVDDPR